MNIPPTRGTGSPRNPASTMPSVSNPGNGRGPAMPQAQTPALGVSVPQATPSTRIHSYRAVDGTRYDSCFMPTDPQVLNLLLRINSRGSFGVQPNTNSPTSPRVLARELHRVSTEKSQIDPGSGQEIPIPGDSSLKVTSKEFM